MPKKLLEGIKVADFSGIIAGPQITKTLAAYGAEVIKIEGRNRADHLRTVRPFKDDIPGLNRAEFNQWNTSKLSVALNLTQPKGVEVAICNAISSCG